MLYQTPHPLLFQFHPLPPSSSSSSSSTLLSLSTTPSLPLSYYHTLPQGETEMECVEAALKTSFRKDMFMKFSPQTFIEEHSAFNVQNGAPCDDFLVDELLDFSHVEQEQEEEEEEQQQQQQEEQQQLQHKEGDSASVCPQQSPEICNPATTTTHHYASLPTSELSVPDDVADLEWLSHFVEDSFSEFSAPIPTVTTSDDNKPKEPTTAQKPDPLSLVPTQPCFKTPVPAKARSKRTRTGVRVWPLGSPSFTDSSSSSTTTATTITTTTTTTTTSSSSSSSPSSPLLIYAQSSMDHVYSEAPAKKHKKKPYSDGSGAATLAAAPRRCSHCGVQKTPQWRTGPLGAKTLCNACGVRYKSGRLLPEYRPACSPTFSSELHSNHHRKVLEMRRKKEITMDGVDTPLAPPPVVPSF